MMNNNENQRNENRGRTIGRILLIIIAIILLLKGCEALLKGSEDMIQSEVELPKVEIPNSEKENSDAEDANEKNLDKKEDSQKKETKERQKRNPSDLMNPSNRMNSGDLSNPSSPSSLSNPVGPSNPSNPVGPSNPSNPSGPSNPVGPSNPSNPVDPIEPKPEKIALKEDDVKVVLPEDLQEDGNAKEFTVILGEGITADIDIIYIGETTDGKAVVEGKYIGEVTVTGTGDYEGTIVKRIDFEITKKEEPKPEKIALKEDDVKVVLPEDLQEDGNAKEFTVILGEGITADVDIIYIGETTDGKAVVEGKYTGEVTVIGTGDYEGTIVKRIDFEITKKEEPKPEKIALKAENVIVKLPENLTVNGRAKELQVTLTEGTTAIITITYEGNTTNGKAIMAGTYVGVVTVVGIGDYEGTIEKRISFTLSKDSDPDNPTHGNPDKDPDDPAHGNPDDTGTGENPDDENNVGNKGENADQETGGNNPDDENNVGAAKKKVQSEPIFTPVEKASDEPKPVPVVLIPEIAVPAPVEETKEDKQSSLTSVETQADIPKQQPTEENLSQQNDVE